MWLEDGSCKKCADYEALSKDNKSCAKPICNEEGKMLSLEGVCEFPKKEVNMVFIICAILVIILILLLTWYVHRHMTNKENESKLQAQKSKEFLKNWKKQIKQVIDASEDNLNDSA